MRTEPKASYRTVQYEYAYRYTPNINIILYGLKTDDWWVFEFIDVIGINLLVLSGIYGGFDNKFDLTIVLFSPTEKSLPVRFWRSEVQNVLEWFLQLRCW